MQFDEFRDRLANADTSTAPRESLLREVKTESARFDREVRRRTLYGAASFLLPIPLIVFLFGIAPQPGPWLRLVEVIVLALLASCAGVVIVRGRKPGRHVPASLPVRDFLQAQLLRVERQAALFRSLKWWFWTPLLAGWAVYLVAFFGGAFERNLFSVLNLFLLPVLAYFGLRATQRYLEREILPWQSVFAGRLKNAGEIAES